MTRSIDSQALTEALAAESQLHAFARALAKDEHSARDLMQHAWLRSLEQGVRDNLGGFLRRVMRNRAIDDHRTGERRTRRERATARAATVPSTDEMVAREQLRRRLADAVTGLEEPYRTTIWLRFFEDRTPRDVAKHMDVPVETVRTRTRRALERLRADLDSEYGDRSKWMALVLPLVRPSTGIPIVTAAAGILMMNKFLFSATLTVLIAIGVYSSDLFTEVDDAPDRGGELPAVAGERAQVEGLPTGHGQGRTALQSTELETPGVTHTGFARFSDHTPGVGLDFWLWRSPEPRQAWVPPHGARLGNTLPVMPEKDGVTHTDGRWSHALPVDEEVFGITLRYSPNVLVSYPFESDSRDVILPDPATLTVRVQGAPPNSRWWIRAYPGLRVEDEDDPNAAEWAMTYAGDIHTYAGHAVYYVERFRQRLGADEVFTAIVPNGQGFGLEIEGIGFVVKDRERFADAPGDVIFEVEGVRPVVTVEITENGERANVNGRAIIKANDRLTWVEDIVDGEVTMSADYELDREYEALVLLDDAEQFETRLRFSAQADSKHIQLERGSGRPRERFPLPMAARSQLEAVVIEHADGRIERVEQVQRQYFSDNSPIYSFGVTTESVYITFLPETWSQVYLCASDGRVWKCARHRRSPVVLPSERLPDQDLDKLREQYRVGPYGFFSLSFVWQTTGDAIQVPLHRIRFDPATDGLPVWKVHRTPGFELLFTVHSGRERIVLPLR